MPMSPNEIKAALVERGVKQVSIARLVDLSPQYVYDVISGARRNEKIESAIAVAICRPVEEVFPVEQPASAAPAA
jgi:predicted transcriptional regulator